MATRWRRCRPDGSFLAVVVFPCCGSSRVGPSSDGRRLRRRAIRSSGDHGRPAAIRHGRIWCGRRRWSRRRVAWACFCPAFPIWRAPSSRPASAPPCSCTWWAAYVLTHLLLSQPPNNPYSWGAGSRSRPCWRPAKRTAASRTPIPHCRGTWCRPWRWAVAASWRRPSASKS